MGKSKSTVAESALETTGQDLFTRQPQFGSLGEGKLLTAIRKGHTDVAKAIIEKNPALLNRENGRWWRAYPLAQAVWKNNLELVQFFLERGADPNIHAERGKFAILENSSTVTPLARAVWNGSFEISELLLSYGADPNLSGRDYSPFMWAVSQNRTDLVELFLTQSRIPVDINKAAEFSKKTALMLAAEMDNSGLVYRLLKEWADPLLKDKNGKTALMHAREPNGRLRPYSACARLLIDAIQKRIAAYRDLPDSGKLGMHDFMAKLAGKNPFEEFAERFDAMAPDKQEAFLAELSEVSAKAE